MSIELDHNSLFYAMKDEAFHGAVLNLNLDGETVSVLLRDNQMHPWKPQVLHVDFQRINAAEKITARVALHFKNADISPAVKLNGKKVSHIANSVSVRALPADLPAFIEVDLAQPKPVSPSTCPTWSCRLTPSWPIWLAARSGCGPVFLIPEPESGRQKRLVAWQRAVFRPAFVFLDEPWLLSA